MNKCRKKFEKQNEFCKSNPLSNNQAYYIGTGIKKTYIEWLEKKYMDHIDHHIENRRCCECGTKLK